MGAWRAWFAANGIEPLTIADEELAADAGRVTDRTQNRCRRAARAGIIHLMVHCHGSRLPLAIRLQRRSTLAGFLVNSISAGMLAVYMTVVFPPETDSLFITREFALTAVGIYTLICGVTSYRSAQPVFDRMRAG